MDFFTFLLLLRGLNICIYLTYYNYALINFSCIMQKHLLIGFNIEFLCALEFLFLLLMINDLLYFPFITYWYIGLYHIEVSGREELR